MSKKKMIGRETEETFWTLRALQDYRKRLLKVSSDPERDCRLDMGLCHVCYYLRRGICGQGFTEYECRECGKTHMHENTCVPKLCSQCAKSSGRCRKCAADLEAVEKEAKLGSTEASP